MSPALDVFISRYGPFQGHIVMRGFPLSMQARQKDAEVASRATGEKEREKAADTCCYCRVHGLLIKPGYFE